MPRVFGAPASRPPRIPVSPLVATMIYPIGHTTLPLCFERRRDAAVVADGVPLTDAEGWIDVPMPASAVAAGAPERVALRLRAEKVSGRRWFFIAEALATGAERYLTLFELMTSGARAWLPELGPALDAEIERRVAEARRPQSGYHLAVQPGADAGDAVPEHKPAKH